MLLYFKILNTINEYDINKEIKMYYYDYLEANKQILKVQSVLKSTS